MLISTGKVTPMYSDFPAGRALFFNFSLDADRGSTSYGLVDRASNSWRDWQLRFLKRFDELKHKETFTVRNKKHNEIACENICEDHGSSGFRLFREDAKHNSTKPAVCLLDLTVC